MGLDMYLSARKYVEKIDWKKMHDDEDATYKDATLPQFDAIVKASGLADLADDIYGATVQVNALYWRKQNAIHNWFVNNVQDGQDDCGEYHVSKDKLDELLAVCEEVYKTRDPEPLMTVSGFFFGSTDIDEWYWMGIKNTIKGLKRIKKHKDFDRLSFYYQSSW